ncbi:hypothetical protein J8L88_15795 [Aquimarina sp. MMG015]|uniref:hypothetical protein n=1 Tax=Aquimarina sp. MMG015 TaxID=2822689 RepID=UPI001B3A6826|nr:hypothetical protein [Aquimarina sp. MMG015]MBQ4804327.1 hypothetical protein [Aquimarina sp. MMG015]
MKIVYKIKAQAMQFALLISVIIAILLSTFLLLTHVQSFFRIKSKEIIEASDIANNQIFGSLLATTASKDTTNSSIDTKTIKLATNYHGAWTKTFSEVAVKESKIRKIAFTGAALALKTPNLYLANKNAPLVVVGNTRLEGNSYLPEQGIKAGNISGNYYQGSSLYYGSVIESKATIPELDNQWISYIESIIKGGYIDEARTIPIAKEVKNSFYDTAKIIYTNESIVLGNEKISGNVVIQSSSKITITSASQLTDVVVIAPIIIVEDYVKGRFQLIASKKIEIGKNCYLSYPSSATLLDKKNISRSNTGNTSQNRNPDFSIDKNTVIQGSIVYLKNESATKNRIKTNLNIAIGTEVIGEIYCQGNIEFMGTIKGSLYTQQFIANQSGSVYMNHLYNGKILVNPIPKYAGLPFKNVKKNIATWLY